MSDYIKFVMGMSLLVFIPIVWHFATVFGYLGEPPVTRQGFFRRIGAIFVLFIVLSGIVAARVASKKGDRAIEPDERERAALVKVERNGSHVIALGLIAIAWFAFDGLSPMQIANAALAVIAFSEVVKLITGFIYLRPSA